MKVVARFICSLLLVGVAFGQSENAARLAVASSHQLDRVYPAGSWFTVLTTPLKKPNNKDLFIHASLECRVVTGGTDTDVALWVVATVDGKATRPEKVVFCGKNGAVADTEYSTMAACSNVGNGHSVSLNSCNLTAAQSATIARSLRAHSFNFLFYDLPVGEHTVSVQIFVDKGNEPDARGIIGGGTLEVTVENLKNKDVGP
jgi:hypothetical protein